MLDRFASAFTVALVASSLVACSSAVSSSPTSTPQQPLYVTIRLEQVLVAPTKADGTPWDGLAFFQDTSGAKVAAAAIRAAMGSSPYATVAFTATLPIVMAAGEAFDKPDVSGTASLVQNGQDIDTRTLEGLRDAYAPTFGTTWAHVPLLWSTALRVQLMDRDLQFNDPIGIATINAHDLQAAMNAEGHAFPVRVDDQTMNQLLYVLVSVVVEQSMPSGGMPVAFATR